MNHRYPGFSPVVLAGLLSLAAAGSTGAEAAPSGGLVVVGPEHGPSGPTIGLDPSGLVTVTVAAPGLAAGRLAAADALAGRYPAGLPKPSGESFLDGRYHASFAAPPGTLGALPLPASTHPSGETSDFVAEAPAPVAAGHDTGDGDGSDDVPTPRPAWMLVLVADASGASMPWGRDALWSLSWGHPEKVGHTMLVPTVGDAEDHQLLSATALSDVADQDDAAPLLARMRAKYRAPAVLVVARDTATNTETVALFDRSGSWREQGDAEGTAAEQKGKALALVADLLGPADAGPATQPQPGIGTRSGSTIPSSAKQD